MSLLILPRRFRETRIDLKNEAGIEFVTKVSGKYLVEVCRDGKVIRQPFGPKMLPNLITTNYFDFCLSAASTGALRTAMLYARVGTGTTAPANGDLALAAQTQNTVNLFTGGGNTYSNDTVNGACTLTFVYEFPATGSGVTLNEAGLSNSPTGTTSTSGITTHILFPSGVVLNTGDNLRLTYTMTHSIPSIVTPITVSMAAVNGFNISGSMKNCGLFSNIFGTVATGDTSVTSSGSGNSGAICFSLAGNGFLLSAPTSFPTVNTSLSVTVLGSAAVGSLGTYTNGSLTRNQTWTWVPSNPSTTVSNVASIQFTPSLLLILTSAQTKANTNTLAITLSCTMARA